MSTILVESPSAVVNPMLPSLATIEDIRHETSDVATFTLRTETPHRHLPGQFNMVYLPRFGEAAISISSHPESPLSHTIRFVGTLTKALGRLRPGDAIGIRGPYGAPWPIELARGRDLLIVSGGIGLAPLRPVIYEVVKNRATFRTVTLMYGARTPADLLYTSEFEDWRKAGIDLQITADRADDQWKGTVGVVPLLFYRIRLDPKQTVVFTCGPEVMMHFVVYEALARRVPKEAIFLSLERNMKCGIRLCGHCQHGPLFVCHDGPVIGFDRLEPYFNREEF